MRYLIIGNSAAGMSAAEAIRRKDRDGEILLYSDEPSPGYYRPLLPYVIEDAPEGGNLYRDALHTPPDVLVKTGIRVKAILPSARKVILEHGERVEYDRLLLATGASPVRPAIENLQGPGVFVLRTLQDALVIKEAAAEAASAVMIGGGRIGTKMALTLRRLGVEVAIVEMLNWIIPQQLDPEASRIIERRLNELGIAMFFGRKAIRVERSSQQELETVVLDNGSRLPADLVVVCTGIQPNLEVVRDSGIVTGKGILVNKRLETSVPNVYAAGDVVETTDVVTGDPVVSGIWTNAVAMGRVAGENMAGGECEYPGAFSLLNALDIAGIPVISAGVIHPLRHQDCEVYALRKDGIYRKLVFRNDTLAGYLMVGEVERAGLYTALMREHASVRTAKEAMITGSFTYADCLLPSRY